MKLMYRDPSLSKRLVPEERTYIVEGGSQQEGQEAGNPLANLGFLCTRKDTGYDRTTAAR